MKEIWYSNSKFASAMLVFSDQLQGVRIRKGYGIYEFVDKIANLQRNNLSSIAHIINSINSNRSR